jgi:hypothetical protein
VDAFEERIDLRVDALEARLDAKLDRWSRRTIQWSVGMMVAMIGLFAALTRLG